MRLAGGLTSGRRIAGRLLWRPHPQSHNGRGDKHQRFHAFRIGDHCLGRRGTAHGVADADPSRSLRAVCVLCTLRLVVLSVCQAGGAAGAAKGPGAQRVRTPLSEALLRRIAVALLPLLLPLLAPLDAFVVLRQLSRQLSVHDGLGGVPVEMQGVVLRATGPAIGEEAEQVVGGPRSADKQAAGEKHRGWLRAAALGAHGPFVFGPVCPTQNTAFSIHNLFTTVSGLYGLPGRSSLESSLTREPASPLKAHARSHRCDKPKPGMSCAVTEARSASARPCCTKLQLRRERSRRTRGSKVATNQAGEAPRLGSCDRPSRGPSPRKSVTIWRRGAQAGGVWAWAANALLRAGHCLCLRGQPASLASPVAGRSKAVQAVHCRRPLLSRLHGRRRCHHRCAQPARAGAHHC